jgi:hypothetical protein
VAYLLKARNVEAEKHQLLCNARKQKVLKYVMRTAVAVKQLGKHVRGDVTQQ